MAIDWKIGEPSCAGGTAHLPVPTRSLHRRGQDRPGCGGHDDTGRTNARPVGEPIDSMSIMWMETSPTKICRTSRLSALIVTTGGITR